jgi:hypothetical protein
MSADTYFFCCSQTHPIEIFYPINIKRIMMEDFIKLIVKIYQVINKYAPFFGKEGKLFYLILSAFFHGKN